MRVLSPLKARPLGPTTCANGHHLPIANGAYQLQPRFNKINSASGTRVFDVAAENAPMLTGFNIAASAGGSKRTLLRPFPVTVRDGSLDITHARAPELPVDLRHRGAGRLNGGSPASLPRTANYLTERAQQDLDVLPQRPVLDGVVVEAGPVGDRCVPP